AARRRFRAREEQRDDVRDRLAPLELAQLRFAARRHRRLRDAREITAGGLPRVRAPLVEPHDRGEALLGSDETSIFTIWSGSFGVSSRVEIVTSFVGRPTPCARTAT